MTAALETIQTIGSTEARVYTPPLGSLTPETSWGYDCIDFLENICKWELLPWQKWLYIHALEKGPDGVGFRFKTVVILVARQNGKSQWLRGLGMWRLFMDRRGRQAPDCPAARLAVIACQNLDYAESMLKQVVDEVRDHPLLSRELINHRETNGKHRMILTNRRYWRAATASRKGARSLSVDLAELDELREQTTWDAWNAIVPTTTVRQYSQVVAASNAGDIKSEVLRSLRDSATRRIRTGETQETQVALFEWSVPMDVDPKEPGFWYLANPAMGLLNDFTLADLRGYLEAMEYKNMPGFQTEHLCQWVDAMEPGIIPAEHWQETMDPTSARKPNAPLYACLEVNYQRTRSYVAIASRRADGNLHVEVIWAGHGTEGVVPWFIERKGKFAGVAVQRTGAPVSSLIPDLEEAGVPLVEWVGPDIQRGCGEFFDKICEHVVWHRPAISLDRAAASAVARTIGDAWVFDRRNSPVDASPIIACAGATWCEAYRPEVVIPAVHGWDEDLIEQWETEDDDDEW